MISAIACACGNSEKLIRSRLQAAGVKDYMSVPLAIGRDKSLKSVSLLPKYPEIAVLPNYITSHSSYAVVIGYDEDGCDWVDVTKDGEMGQLKLKVIIRDFTNNR